MNNLENKNKKIHYRIYTISYNLFLTEKMNKQFYSIKKIVVIILPTHFIKYLVINNSMKKTFFNSRFSLFILPNHSR